MRVVLIPPERWRPSWNAFTPGSGPDPQAIYRVMASLGVDVELLDPGDWICNSPLATNALYTGLDPLRLVRLLTRYRQVDLVVSVFESSATLPLLTRRIAGFEPKIALWDLVPDEKWLPRRILQRISYPLADGHFLLASQQNEYLRQRYGRIGTVIWQHVDTEFWRPQTSPSSGPILAVGEDAGRDFETFLAAVADLDVDVVVKTRRPLPAVSGRARIRQIRERLSFVELRQLYEAASLVVIPLHQTLNVSGVGTLLEAMAMAKPTIVSDNPVLRDYFLDRETAIVVPIHDVGRLRDAIQELLANPAGGAAYGAAARTLAESRFANPVFARRLADEMLKVTASSGTGKQCPFNSQAGSPRRSSGSQE